MKRLVLILAALLVALPAAAQQKKIGGPVGHALDAIQGQQQGSDAVQQGAPVITKDDNNTGDLWAKITKLTQPDLKYAKALADNAATPGSKLRSACYAAIIAANDQANGTALKDENGQALTAPSPDLITKLERAAELVDNLQPTAPVMSGCAAAANAAKIGTLQFVNTLVAGVAAKALTGGLVP